MDEVWVQKLEVTLELELQAKNVNLQIKLEKLY